jgi:hypothetical protein
MTKTTDRGNFWSFSNEHRCTRPVNTKGSTPVLWPFRGRRVLLKADTTKEPYVFDSVCAAHRNVVESQSQFHVGGPQNVQKLSKQIWFLGTHHCDR